MQPGLNAAAKVFRAKTGIEAKFTYEPPVDLGKRVAGGEAADIEVSSPAVIADLTKAGKVLAGGQMMPRGVGCWRMARCISGGSGSAWLCGKAPRCPTSPARRP